MSDRLDELLSRLPVDQPAPDLTSRISAAVARRRNLRAVRRRMVMLALVCMVIGLMLIGVSWPAAAETIATTRGVDVASVSLEDILAAPVEVLVGLFELLLTWEANLVESLSHALILGVLLLTMSAFVWLAHLLQRPAPLNGYSQFT